MNFRAPLRCKLPAAFHSRVTAPIDPSTRPRAENRLIRVDRQTEPEVFEEVASYTYDALNRRIERRIGERTIHTVWDG